MKHKDELSENRTRGLDRCHRAFKMLGFGYFLFIGISDLDKIGRKLTLNELRYFEWAWFVLAAPTLNTMDQQGSFISQKLIS